MQEHWQAKLKVSFDWFNNALLRLILTRYQEGVEPDAGVVSFCISRFSSSLPS